MPVTHNFGDLNANNCKQYLLASVIIHLALSVGSKN